MTMEVYRKIRDSENYEVSSNGYVRKISTREIVKGTYNEGYQRVCLNCKMFFTWLVYRIKGHSELS